MSKKTKTLPSYLSNDHLLKYQTFKTGIPFVEAVKLGITKNVPLGQNTIRNVYENVSNHLKDFNHLA